MTKMLEAALSYAAKGYKVFPIAPNQKYPPLTPHGCKDASGDESIICEWWKRHPQANIGIATGIVSGFVVVDIDKKSGGLESYVANSNLFPKTLTTLTPGGGMHLFYKCAPSDLHGKIRNEVGKTFQGIDIKTDGGYVVAAPSVLAQGQYIWEDEDAAVTEAPCELWKMLSRKTKKNAVRQKAEKTEEGSRNSTLFRQACFLRSKGWVDDALFEAVTSYNNLQCSPPLSEDEVRRIIENSMKYEPDVVLSGQGFSDTDLGNALLFAKKCKDQLRYCPELSTWLCWDGKCWQPDKDGQVKRDFCSVILNMTFEEYQTETPYNNPDAAEKAYLKHKKKSLDAGGINAGVKVSTYVSDFLVGLEKLDRHDTKLNFQNGTLDLKTLQLRPHNREDFFTWILDHNYNSTAEAPIFQRFLSSIFLDDAEMVAFTQRLLGYCLSGSVDEECIFIFYGNGANGKSTLIELLRYMLGKLAKATPFTTFVSVKGDRVRDDIAALRGARLVTASEVEEGKFLDEAVIKQITGRDVISARPLYQKYFEFKPKFKVVVSVNRLPGVRGTDEGIWRRLKIIPFAAHFPPDKQDKELSFKLESEVEGILAWAIQGYKLWKQQGLNEPKPMKEAALCYRYNMDTLTRFLEDECINDSNRRLQTSVFHDQYERWCQSVEEKLPLKRSAVREAMEHKGYSIARITGTNYYSGIAWRPEVITLAK